MIFSEDSLSLELLGIFKISRETFSSESWKDRIYDSVSIRLNGSGLFKTTGGEFEAKRGSIVYLPRTCNYYQITSGETIIAIHFINYSFYHTDNAEIICPENYNAIEKIIIEMYNVWKEKKRGYKYRCSALLYSLLYELNQQVYNNKITTITKNDKITAAIDYIHVNYKNEQISVSHLAKMCAVSEAYFRKLFKQIYSVSPNQYIINLRLEYACQLLQSHLYTIAEAGEKAGFCDTKYFSRLFHKRFGKSPREYQNTVPDTLWK